MPKNPQSTAGSARRYAILLGILALLSSPLLQAQATTPATTLSATPAVLNFAYQIGATTLPAAQTLAIKSTNPAAISFSLSVTGSGPSAGAWISTSLRPGVSTRTPASVSVSVTPTGLSSGTYTGVITLTSLGITPVVTADIAVNLVVSPPPSTVRFSPANLPAFDYTTSGTLPADQSFVIYTDGAPVSVTIAVTGAPWLRVTPTGSVRVAGLFTPITVAIDPTELAKLVPRVYTANVTISAPTAVNKTSTYPVVLNVRAAVPMVSGTWPSSLIMPSSATSTSATTPPSSFVNVNGLNFFDTSTVSVSGFSPTAYVRVADSSATPIRAEEQVTIPVYASSNTSFRFSVGSPLPTGYATTPYSVSLTSGVKNGSGAYTWAASGLPNDGSLTLNATTGILTGTAPTPGTYNLVITVRDSTTNLLAYLPVRLTIYPSSTPPINTNWIVIPTLLPEALVGGPPYNETIQVISGGGTNPPFNWTLNTAATLPTGLSLGATGATTTITGSASNAGTTSTLTVRRLNDGVIQATVPPTFLTAPGLLRMAVTTPTPGGGTSNEAVLPILGPEPQIFQVVNSASYQSGIVSPGALVTLFGSGLGPSSLSVFDPNPVNLTTTLPTPIPVGGATSVNFTVGATTYPAGLIYTSASQVGVVVPFGLSGAPSAQMTVTYGTQTSQPYSLAVQEVQPGIFSADGSGIGQGAILNFNAATNDYSVNTGANAAVRGNTVVIYVTGFGVTNPSTSSLQRVTASTVTSAVAPSVMIGNVAATSTAAIPVGSVPGLLQINAVVPTTAPIGKAVPVTVSFGATSAQTTITMAIK
jgi:uncharacterized protein (TIGR03437 family)